MFMQRVVVVGTSGSGKTTVAARIAKELDLKVICTASVEAAMAEAERIANGSKIILIAGSIFIAAAARSVWMAVESDKNRAMMGN